MSLVCSPPLQPADVEHGVVQQIRRMGRLQLPEEARIQRAFNDIAANIGPMLFRGAKLSSQQNVAETVLQVCESYRLVLLVSSAANIFLDSRQVL